MVAEMLAQMNTSNTISLQVSSSIFFPSPLPHSPAPLPHFRSPLPPQLFIATKSLSNHPFVLELQPLVCRSRRWDSNAEYDEETDDFDDELEQWTEVLEDYIDSLWIFKVFGSFGWMLPFILISLLLATGSKAFLMALALPVGQSTISFAFQRLWDRGKRKPKRKTKVKRGKSRRPRRSMTVRLDEEWEGRGGTRRKLKTVYQSWVSRNDVEDKNGNKGKYNFGGWDEFDLGEDLNIGSSRRQDRPDSRSSGVFMEEEKSSKIESQSDMPLLLRLLVAVFPFLGSFTKIL